MESLPVALFIVMLELTVGSFVSLYLLDLRGDSSRGFIRFQGVLYLVFAGLTLLAMNTLATPHLVQGRGLDERWLAAQGPLVLFFTLLMVPWNILLMRDPGSSYRLGKKAAPQSTTPAGRDGQTARSGVRLARYAVGGLTCFLGLAALLIVGMAYRTLAESRLGGAFVVIAILAGALALGGVMTAMLLGHWYLNTPTLSGKPLEFMTLLTLVALAFELVCALLIGPSTARPTAQQGIQLQQGTIIQTGPGGLQVITPTSLPTAKPGTAQSTPAPGAGQVGPTGQEPRQTPLDTGAMAAMQFILGFLAPLGLGAAALRLTRGRSFQSATGMLYLCVAFIFIGEILARGLLVIPIARF